MDYSALLNALLTEENVKEISKETKTTPDEVNRVVKAAIPLFEENGAQAAETKLTRAASNGTNRSILGTLLGAGASAAISQNSGVSNKKTSSILSLIAPLLLSSMLGTSSNASSNSGLTSLLGGLLGLGGTQQTQTVQTQQNNTAGTLSLLSSLLGAGMASQQQTVQQPQTISLFGNQQVQQPVHQTYANNTAAGASLLSSLLGMGNLGQAQQTVQVQPQVQQPQTISLFGNQQQAQPQAQASQGGGLMDLLMGLISTDTSGN
ncbi:MAG: DUF937 domain-containing protein [Lachnospiraceae bacterium]|nr:DUF937 domain-containing protein [Lachnospiraceae bacterium]